MKNAKNVKNVKESKKNVKKYSNPTKPLIHKKKIFQLNGELFSL